MSNCGYNKNTVCHYFTYIYVYVLFCLTESFLNNRFQKKALNDQTSKWLPVIARVPQRSILGPFFPLIILMTYQTIYYQQQNSLQMTHLIFCPK